MHELQKEHSRAFDFSNAQPFIAFQNHHNLPRVHPRQLFVDPAITSTIFQDLWRFEKANVQDQEAPGASALSAGRHQSPSEHAL
jgi:hypothetical protein